MNIINALNNREIATAIWLTIIFLWAVTIKDVRSAILDLLKAFFNKKIVIPLLAMLLYIVLMVLAFKNIGFWDISATKDTILWTFGSAFATFFSLNKVAKDSAYFKNVILYNIKFVLILEFVVNLYSFSLPAELIVMPIASFIVVANVLAETKPEYKRVNKLFNFALGAFGLYVLAFTFREIVLDFQNFATLKNLRDFLLPPLFSIVLLPFVYVMALFMQYEMFFVRIDIANRNLDNAKFAKEKIIAACHINLSKLNKVSKKAGYPKVNEKEDALEWLIKRKGSESSKRRKPTKRASDSVNSTPFAGSFFRLGLFLVERLRRHYPNSGNACR